MSIFTDLKPHAQNVRNVYDLSHNSTFSSKVGLNLPVFVQHTIPDSDFKVKLSGIIRTAPMQTANFESIKSNVEFFFVPYSQLWRNFNRFYYGRGESTRNIKNVYQSLSNSQYTPRFNYRLVVLGLLEYGFYQLYFDTHFFPLLKQIQGFKRHTSNASSPEFWEEYNVQHVLTNSKKIVDYFFQKDYTSLPGQSYNFRNVHGDVCALDCIRNFDMLGYGNWLPVLKSIYSSFYDFYKISTDFEASTSSELSAFGQNIFNALAIENNANAMASLYSHIHGAFQTIFNNLRINELIPSITCNSFAIQAFMKVNADYYRSTQYDTTDYSYFYNCDFYDGSSSSANNDATSLLTTQKVIFMLKPFYHLYKKDSFTGSFSDTQFGDVAVAGIPSSFTDLHVENEYGTKFEVDLTAIGPDNVLRATSLNNQEENDFTGDVVGLTPNSLSVSVLAMRQAIALQHWKETILRAGNREADLQSSIFGVGSKYIQDEYVDFIDGVAGTINVNPIAATAATDSADIGELGAYSVGTISGDEFHYKAKDFGVLIGVQYIMLEVKYNSFGIDPMNIKQTQFDFFNPKFQNLGLAPVYSQQFNLFSSNKVLGYLARYHEYKTKHSVVHGEFYNSSPLELNNLDSDDIYVGSVTNALNMSCYNGILANQTGSKSFWVTPRTIDNLVSLSLSSLYVSPHDLDNLFYASSDGQQSSDQFDFEFYFEVKAIQPMTVSGLPQVL